MLRSLSISIAILSFATAAAHAAGEVNQLAVERVRIDKSGKGYFKFAGNLGGVRSACMQSTYASVLGFDANTAGGRSIMALALAAKASGQIIYAVGTGDCTAYSVMEDWSWGRAQ